MLRTSKSRTFEESTEIQEIVDFVFNTMETEDYGAGMESFDPSDITTITKNKYMVTITKIVPVEPTNKP